MLMLFNVKWNTCFQGIYKFQDMNEMQTAISQAISTFPSFQRCNFAEFCCRFEFRPIVLHHRVYCFERDAFINGEVRNRQIGRQKGVGIGEEEQIGQRLIIERFEEEGTG